MRLEACRHAPKRDLMKALPSTRIRKTWRTAIEKASGPSDAEYQWLHDIADAATPEIRRRFLAAIKAIRGTVKEAELRAALESGSIEQVMTALGLGDLSQMQGALMAPLNEIVRESAIAALDATPALAARGGAVSMRFDMVNPHTVQAVRTYGFNLIQQISDDTRDGIRAIVANALEYGGHPYEQARQIRNLIGLTDSQAEAVDNFRTLLEDGDRGALDRALRDRRFDSTLEQALGQASTIELSPEHIDRMVDRYAERMLNARAETIARTETINAARLGTQNAWVQATENGLLDRTTVRQGWLVTPDDRLCVYCAEVPEMNPDGVPLGQKFKTPLGLSDGPALHPNCRCALYLLDF